MNKEGLILISDKSFSSPFTIDQVKQSNPTPQYEYGVYNVIDGYLWEKYLTNGSEKLKKIGAVSSTSSTAYPVNGVHTDGYWYERFNSRSTYVPDFNNLTDTFYNQNEITTKYQGKQYQDSSTITQNVRQYSSYDDIIEGGYGVDISIYGSAPNLNGSLRLTTLSTGKQYKSLSITCAMPTNYDDGKKAGISYNGRLIFHLERSQGNSNRYSTASVNLTESVKTYSGTIDIPSVSGYMDYVSVYAQGYDGYLFGSLISSGYGYNYGRLSAERGYGISSPESENIYNPYVGSYLIPYGDDVTDAARVFKSGTQQYDGEPCLYPLFVSNNGVRKCELSNSEANDIYNGITCALMTSKTSCLFISNQSNGTYGLYKLNGFSTSSQTGYASIIGSVATKLLYMYAVPGTTNVYLLGTDGNNYPRIYQHSVGSNSISDVTSSFSAFNNLRTQTQISSCSSFKVMPGSNWVMINGYEYCRKQTTTTTTVTIESPGYTSGNYPSKILYPISK